MSGREDDADDSEHLPDDEPSSGAQVKRAASVTGQLLLADIRRRIHEAAPEEREAVIAAGIEEMIEHRVRAAPAALREEMREKLRAMLAGDPGLQQRTVDVGRGGS